MSKMKTEFIAAGSQTACDATCKIYLNHPADKTLPYMNIVVTGSNLRIFMFKLNRKQMKSLAHNLLKASTPHNKP